MNTIVMGGVCKGLEMLWDVQLNVLQHGSCLAVQRRVLARSGTGVEAQLFGT
jgi:hypothetical protein